MSKVLVDRELLERIERCYMDGMSIYGECEEIRAILAQPAEAEGVEAVEFWVLFDATTPEPYIKKMMPEGFLAFFDHEEDAIRAKSFHPGTDYKRVPYVRRSEHLAALSAVTAERDGEAESCEQWRALALQFDRHRMSALAHLKMVVAGQEGALDACRDFLAAPPVPGHEITAEIDQLRAEVEALRARLVEQMTQGTPQNWSRGGGGIPSAGNFDKLSGAMAAKEA